MGSARFLRLAERTPYFEGVMQERVRADRDGQDESSEVATRVDSTPAAMAAAGFDIEYASV